MINNVIDIVKHAEYCLVAAVFDVVARRVATQCVAFGEQGDSADRDSPASERPQPCRGPSLPDPQTNQQEVARPDSQSPCTVLAVLEACRSRSEVSVLGVAEVVLMVPDRGQPAARLYIVIE